MHHGLINRRIDWSNNQQINYRESLYFKAQSTLHMGAWVAPNRMTEIKKYSILCKKFTICMPDKGV